MATEAPQDIVDAEIVSEAPHSIIVRKLEPAEFDRLKGVGLFAKFELPDMAHVIPIVGQDSVTGEVVAYWLLFDAVHVEPLWIAESHRKKPGLARRLWNAVLQELITAKVHIAFACIGDNDMAMNMPAASRLGFQKMHGSLFFLEVKPEGAEAEGWKSAGEQVREQLTQKGE